MTSRFAHTPVLLTETIEALQPRPGGRYIDATLGAGGHAEKVLELSRPNGVVLGIDADPIALDAASRRLASFGDRLITVNAYFDDLANIARRSGIDRVDGIVFDLGVSSPQFDQAARGFSFQAEGPLDMRMGPSATTTAEELVNNAPLFELQRIFQEYGEERYARRIAKRIGEVRARRRITATEDLAAIVSGAVPGGRHQRIHPATRVFQALRIAVNDELGRLRRVLPQTLELLNEGGRLVVISFHSLEDRIVKQFMRNEARGCVCPPGLPTCICGHTPTLRLLTTRPISSSPWEVEENPRARSAKLRAAVRLSAGADGPTHGKEQVAGHH